MPRDLIPLAASCDVCGGPLFGQPDDPLDVKLVGAHDVVCERGCTSQYVPAETRARSRIAALRLVVRDHRATRVDGYLVDPTTALMLVAVYEALGPEARELFGRPDLLNLANAGWRAVERSRGAM